MYERSLSKSDSNKIHEIMYFYMVKNARKKNNMLIILVIYHVCF